jgi:hypothetical protein
MPNIHLYTTFYNEKNDFRRKELFTCLKYNLQNTAIAKVTLFNEGDSLAHLNTNSIDEILITQRPTYQDFINYINKHTSEEDIHIIANTDIYFDKHIGVLQHLNLKNTCLAISRWDTTETKKPKLYNHNDSQDVWIFKGHIKPELNANFPLGVPRCDNRLLYEIERAGYTVLNPAFSIKSYHIHKGQRALVYTEDDNVYKIAPPYRYKYPHNLYGFWQTLFFNIRKSCKLGAYRYDIKKINAWWVIRLPRKLIKVLTKKQLPLIGYK